MAEETKTETTETTETKPDTTATTPTDAPKFKIKVDGTDREVSADELVRLAQKGLGAEKRFEEAAEIRKKAEMTQAEYNELTGQLKKAVQDNDEEAAEWILKKLGVEAKQPEPVGQPTKDTTKAQPDGDTKGLPEWEVLRRVDELETHYDEAIAELKAALPLEAHEFIEWVAGGKNREAALLKAVETHGLAGPNWSLRKSREAAKEAAKQVRKKIEEGLKASGSTHLGRAVAGTQPVPPPVPKTPRFTGDRTKDAQAAQEAKQKLMAWIQEQGAAR